MFPNAPGKRTRVDVLATEPTPASSKLEQVITRADGYYDQMIALSPDDPSYKTFAVSIEALINSVDAQLKVHEAKELPKKEAEAFQAVRQQWRQLVSDTMLTLDEALGRGTGIALVDHGPRCAPVDGSEPPVFGCVLSDTRRGYLLDALSHVVLTSMQNFHAAAQNARVDELVKTEHGWGFLAEVLFGMASGGVIGVALKGLSLVKAAAASRKVVPDYWDIVNGVEDKATLLDRIAAVPESSFKGLLGNASRGARNVVRSGHLKAHGRTRVGFLELLQSQIKPLADKIYLEAPTMLDDAGLVALTMTYNDENTNSEGSYRGFIDGLLQQFDDSQIGKIGSQFEGGGRYELKEDGGVYKVIKQHGTGAIGEKGNAIGGRADQYYVIYDDGRVEVVSTVPPALEAIAVKIDESARIENAVTEAKREAQRNAQLHLLDDYTKAADSAQNRRLDRRGL